MGGRNRKKNRRRRNKHQQDPQSPDAHAKSAARRFTEHSHTAHLQHVLKYEEYKQSQQKFLDEITDLQNDRMHRTVFVSNVKDLTHTSHLQLLERFMANTFGPVETCRISSYKRKKKQPQNNRRVSRSFPPALVRFVNKSDAEKIFGGRSLVSASPRSAEIPCPIVGAAPRDSCREPFIRVLAAHRDKVLEDLQSNSIHFSSNHVGIGHWIPTEEDAYLQISQKENGDGAPSENPREVFSEEKLLNNESISVNIDMESRTVNMRRRLTSDSVIPEMNESLAYLLSDILNINSVARKTDILTFRFKHVKGYIDICEDESHDVYLVFSLHLPPKLYIETSPSDSDDFEWTPAKERQTQYAGLDGSVFGMCLGFKMRVSKNTITTLKLAENLRRFGLFRAHTEFDRNFGQIHVAHISNSLLQFDRMVDIRTSKLHENSAHLGFLLRACIDACLFPRYTLERDKIDGLTLIDLLLQCAQSERSTRIAIEVLEQMMSSPERTNYPACLFNLLFRGLETETEREERTIPAHCTLVPSLILSPCRACVTGIDVEMSNRVLRIYAQEEKFGKLSMLRVHIADEDGSKLFATELSEAIIAKMKSVLLDGLLINGKKFQVLGYSSSQLKQCSMWCVALPVSMTIEKLRDELGNFRRCSSASKFAARLGQCFTTTSSPPSPIVKQSLPVSSSVVRDISSEMPGKEHSDGTGLIRRETFDQYVSSVPSPPKVVSDASIIQIRFGGAKGTLSAWDPTVMRTFSTAVVLRDSMDKFDSQRETVEICKIGSTVPYYLNRHVILLLKSHQVPDSTFHALQDEMLGGLDTMLHDGRKAMRMLPRLAGPESGIRQTLMNLLENGKQPNCEPFLFSCLHAIRSHHLYGLRKKSRILVDDGCVLMGGLDETRSLQEGCVFAQLEENGVHRVLEGPVMVTKHPALHPGDIRMLNAVNVPALRDHRNVILFSQHGHRPESDKMSGSDLDGDEYAITWDRRLFLKHLNSLKSESLSRLGVADLDLANDKPMEYDTPSEGKPAPLPQSKLEWTNALLSHFFHHAQADILGYIATLWLDYAAKGGANCPECIQLAGYHSTAVDFPKSGIPVPFTTVRELGWKGPKSHWRELKGYETFHCKSIIGQLYDNVISRNSIALYTATFSRGIAGRKNDSYGSILSIADNRSPLDDDEPFDQDLATRIFPDVSEEALWRAGEIFESFKDEMLKLMRKYHVRSEGEIITGCIRKFHKLHKKKQHDISELVRLSCKELREHFQDAFFDVVVDLATDRVPSDEMSSLLETLYPTIAGPKDQVEAQALDDRIDSYWPQLKEIATVEATSSRVDDTTVKHQLRLCAFELAAACYISCYAPQFRARSPTVLYSFPWVVAGSVIGAALDESK